MKVRVGEVGGGSIEEPKERGSYRKGCYRRILLPVISVPVRRCLGGGTVYVNVISGWGGDSALKR